MNKFAGFLTLTALCALPMGLTAATESAIKPTGKADQSSFKINYSLKDDGREWKEMANESIVQNLASEGTDADNVLFRVRKFVLADESTTEKPTQVFVIEKLTINPQDEASSDKIFLSSFFKGFSEELEKETPNVKFEKKILNQDEHSMLAEWSTVSPPQHGLVKEIKSGHNIAVLIYVTSKENDLDQKRKEWISILNNATITSEKDSEDKEPTTK